MKFEITSDNESYVNARGKIVLNACPGSGKTTAVAFKLTQVLNECKNKFGGHVGVACLSFTNVAKDEINHKYQQFTGTHIGYPHTVSTIDSFINKYITLPFYYLLEKKCVRPWIIDDTSFLNGLNLGAFFSLKKTPLKYTYPPSGICIEKDSSYTWNGHLPNPDTVDLAVFKKYCVTYKKWQFEHGLLGNLDSTVAALGLLNRFSSISKYLVHRFPYLIIDEAQDTSEIQYAIMDELIKSGLKNIELIGDPYQSLYEFRQARPDLFINRWRDLANWQGLQLVNCRRSTQKIIDCYSIFKVSSDSKIRSVSTSTSDAPVHIIRFDENNTMDIINKFKSVIDPGEENRILVRGTKHMELLGVTLPNEKPWKSAIPYMIIEAEKQYGNQATKHCINLLRKAVVQILNPDSDIGQLKKIENELKEDSIFNSDLFALIKGMPSVNASLEDWTVKMTKYINDFYCIKTFDMGLKQRKGKTYYAQIVRDVFSTKSSSDISVTTIHQAKGMTFDSVLLLLSDKSQGQNISLSDMTRPRVLPNEKQRLIYVALSRPRKLACIAVPNSVSEIEVSKILGENIKFI